MNTVAAADPGHAQHDAGERAAVLAEMNTPRPDAAELARWDHQVVVTDVQDEVGELLRD